MNAKVIFLAISLMINAVTVTAQDSNNNTSELETYLEMQRKGRNLMIGGAVAFLVAQPCIWYPIVAMLDMDNEALLGTLLITGSALAITGNILVVTGFHKNRNAKRGIAAYQSKPNSLRIEPYYTPKHAGIALTYRF